MTLKNHPEIPSVLSGNLLFYRGEAKARTHLDDCTASSKINEDPGSYQSVAKVN